MQKLAVIMSIYKNDRLEYVKLAVESILKQTYSSFDFYIQFDGMVDANIEDYFTSLSDERVWVQSRAENLGLAKSLNELLEIVRLHDCEYIARMDADDISLPVRIEKQMAFLEQHRDIDVVGGAIEEIDENGNNIGKVVSYPLTHQECLRFFEKRNPLAHPAVLFRYSFFEKLKGAYRADHPKNQDTMLWLDGLMAGCKMANVPDVVLQFRVTNDLFRKRRNGWNLAMRQLADRLEVNRGLKYGVMSYLYAYATFLMQISPAWVKKLCYRYLR